MRRPPAVPGLIGEWSGGGILADASGHLWSASERDSERAGLYRWTVGRGNHGAETHPVFVKNNVGSGSWVPSKIGFVS